MQTVNLAMAMTCEIRGKGAWPGDPLLCHLVVHYSSQARLQQQMDILGKSTVTLVVIAIFQKKHS